MRKSIFSLLALLALLVSCKKNNPETTTTDGVAMRYYGNIFAYNVMNSYYLWKNDIADKVKTWPTDADPVEQVKEVRVSQDHWTALYEDATIFEGSVTGTQTTMGLDITPVWADEQQTRVAALVNFTYADSPARKAGLKRGDVIMTIDGSDITKDNYSTELSKLYYASQVQIGLYDGRTLDLKAVMMYENPVHLATILYYGGKKIGYLHFTNFTLTSCRDLETAFSHFKAQGIDELVLDLSYNGGGYVITANVLASMIAPLTAVQEKAVYTKEVYNDILDDDMSEDTCFAPEFTLDLDEGKTVIHTADANPGLERLWVLTTSDTASASEALICGLKPYMPVTLVGHTTHGKFCGGVLVKAPDWYKAVEKENPGKMNTQEAIGVLPQMGLYVIISRYADCNGVTLSMPDGIPAEIPADDKPWETTELGEPTENMLSVALQAITDIAPPAATTKASAPSPTPVPFPRPGFGVLLH